MIKALFIFAVVLAGILLLMAGVLSIAAMFIMLGWGAFIPSLTNLPLLSFTQALGMALLVVVVGALFHGHSIAVRSRSK